MNEIFIGIIILVFLLAVFFSGRKGQIAQVESEKELIHSEKENWNKERLLTVAQVRNLRDKALEWVESELGADHPDQVEELKELIQEWAELKEKSFQDRRSWIRKPTNSPE